jgi:Protein  of unknown function (DUF3018)
MTGIAKKPKSSSERVAAYRKRMREAGLVSRTIWVPNLKDPKVLAEFRRQAKLIGDRDRAGEEIQPWLDALAEWPEQYPDYDLPADET